MDQGLDLPDEIMERDDVVRQWQNKNSASNPENWAQSEWSTGYEEDSGITLQDKSLLLSREGFNISQNSSTLGTSRHDEKFYPGVGECLYIQWVEDENSTEAAGWYFGTIESIMPDGQHEILYADNATEVLDLSKVNFVPAKPGSKFFLPSKPKPFKAKSRYTPKSTKAKQRRTPKKNTLSAERQSQTLQALLNEQMLSGDIQESIILGEFQENKQTDREMNQQVPDMHEGEMVIMGEQTSENQQSHQTQHSREMRQESHQDIGIYQQEQEDHSYQPLQQKQQYQPSSEHIQQHEYQHHQPQHHQPQQHHEPDHLQQDHLQQDHLQQEQHPEEEDMDDIIDNPNQLMQEDMGDSTQQRGKSATYTSQVQEPSTYINGRNIIIPNMRNRLPGQQIILVQRGANGELEEVRQDADEDDDTPAEPVATIIEETTEVETQIGHIEEEHEYAAVQQEDDEDEDSNTEIIYPEDCEDEDRGVNIEINRKVAYSQEAEVIVDRDGNQILQRGNVQLVRRQSPTRMSTDQYLPPHTSEQVERYDGRIISSEQMLMGSTQKEYQPDDMVNRGMMRDVENYNDQRYQDSDHNDDLERLQGRLITEDAMNLMEEKNDDDEYSGDDDQDPRMPRRRGKYVRKTPEELDQVPRPWSCEFCPRAFPNKYHLQIHLRTHTGEKPYRCTECDMAFSHSSNLCSHIRTHNGIKPYKCKHCGKEFGRSNNMKAHTRIHTGEKPFECRFCGKAFRFGNHLTIHERSHTGERPYKCTYCDRAFRNSSNLRTHERLHTDERPYRCRYCDRAFSGSGNLHAHERVHTGERPFVCDVCQKAFSQSSTLRIHQRIHTGDKRYQCSLCGRRFIQSNHLKTHLRRMHHIDDSLPSIRTMHKADPYSMQSMNPNSYRVVTKQEPEDHFERESQRTPMMIKRDHHNMESRPSPLVVDDDVRTKGWAQHSPYDDEDSQRGQN